MVPMMMSHTKSDKPIIVYYATRNNNTAIRYCTYDELKDIMQGYLKNKKVATAYDQSGKSIKEIAYVWKQDNVWQIEIKEPVDDTDKPKLDRNWRTKAGQGKEEVNAR
jgi:hypothetical protein